MGKVSAYLASRKYKNVMAKIYGLGASVVLVGALFKLTHWKGANAMLTVGLLTEAIIFAFSAFEPIHIEPDWSLVYPELWDAFHDEDEVRPEHVAGTSRNTTNGTSMNQFNDLLESANINEETLKKLGTGINKLGETAGRLADISGAMTATSDYTKVMAKTAQTAASFELQLKNIATVAETSNQLNATMVQFIEKVNASASSQEALNKQIADMSKRMSAMNTVYGNMLSAMNIKA
ncbi:MAG: gliding motility protein GldL [Bacteroidales bacterium]|nr:gliding motility protein GldL [Bacteroidales bacterium]